MNSDKLIDNILTSIKTFLIIILYTLILPALLYSVKISTNVQMNLIIKSIITSALVLFLFKDKLIKDIKSFKKEYITENYRYYILGFLGMILCNGIISAIIPGLPINESINRSFLNNSPIAFLISAVILGPINEELIFRVNFDFIKNKKIFVIFTSVFFALLHAINGIEKLAYLVYFLPYFILAISFAYIYRKTNNLCASSFFHICHNALSVILLVLF